MTNVNRVQGPSGPGDSPSEKKSKAADEKDQFKKLMRVEKVSEVDPEQKKKRRQRAEEEEEVEETPSNQNAPLFSLGSPSKKVAEPTSTVAPKTFATAKSNASMPTEAAAGEERFTDDSLPTESPSELSTPSNAPTPSSKTTTPSSQTESKDTQPLPKAEKKEGPLAAPSEKKPSPKEAKAPSIKNPQDETSVIPGKENTPLEEEKITSPTSLQKEKNALEEKLPSTNEEQPSAVASIAPEDSPLSKLSSHKEKASKKAANIEKEAPQDVSSLASPTPAIPITETPQASPPQPHFVYMHPQVMELFDRMVGVVTVMNQTGVTETTITLNSPQFASSAFFGSQIVLTEFSTAPKAYNVQLIGSPQAVNLFAKNQSDLVAAFQSGSYNFKINRIDTSLLSENKPLFRRKEGSSSKNNDNQNSEKDERSNS